MNVYLTGASVVRRSGARPSPSGSGPQPRGWDFLDPGLMREIAALYPRFGRFDEYTQIGCAAIFAAARDAGIRPGGPFRNVGLVLAGQYGSFDTDEAFYASTSAGPELASPNLFSYTLPNIVIGECALQFRWMGPTYCLDGDGGRGQAALAHAALLLEGGRAEAVLAGWLEVLPPWAPAGEEGAAALFFEAKQGDRRPRLELVTAGASGMSFPSGSPAATMDDILRAAGLLGFGPSPAASPAAASEIP